MEREPHDPVGGGVADHAVRLDRARPADEALAAGPDDELAQAPVRVGDLAGCLRSEALVVVVVARQADVGVRVVEVVPDRPHPARVAGWAEAGPRAGPGGGRAL